MADCPCEPVVVARLPIRYAPYTSNRGAAVLRYYFDLIEEDDYVEDVEGLDLPDIDVARSMAVKTARSLIAHGVLAGRLALRGSVRVLDESGSRVLELQFLDALSRSDNISIEVAPSEAPLRFPRISGRLR